MQTYVSIKMEVFHLHHATNGALCKLPEDTAHLIKSFLCQTRLDWRTCRTHEANLIKKLHRLVVISIADPDVDDWVFDASTTMELNTWTLFGVLHLISWLNKGGAYQFIHRFGRPRFHSRPDYRLYGDKYQSWYLHTFMWYSRL